MSIYPKIARNIFLPLGDRVMGTSVLKHLKFLEKSQWWSLEDLKEYQNKKLRALIKHAYENVSYYHKVFRERGLYPGDIQTCEDLIKLPILTKEIIRENFPEKIFAKNISKKQTILEGSSGSTGEPLQYYITKDAYCFNIACRLRGWQWMGYQLGGEYIKLSQNPRDMLNKKIYDKIFRCDYILSQSLTQKNITDIIEKIRKSKAKMIRGYPSTLSILSSYIKKNGIADIKPHAINTTGEILFPYMRKLIETQFHCPVFDSYSGEGGANISECETHKTYHISAEYAFTELIDNGERITSEGRGEIVSTNLWNYAVPFIRYNVKDVAVLKNKRCSCSRGLPVLDKIEGRDTDILITPSGKYLIVHYFTGYFEWVDSVEQFQVVQNEIDKITLNLVPNNKFNDKAKSRIQNDIGKYVGDDIKLEIEIVDDIPLTPSGKRRFVIRNIPFEL